jgi:uncharacterized protein (DUF2384 family)
MVRRTPSRAAPTAAIVSAASRSAAVGQDRGPDGPTPGISDEIDGGRSGSRQNVVRLPLAMERTEFLIDAVGSGSTLADLLGVSRSQPTRWRTGKESPSPQIARELVDLDHVMARASMLFTQPVALDWLNSSNTYLDGARPIDVLKTRGSAEVIAALDAAMAGAFS